MPPKKAPTKAAASTKAASTAKTTAKAKVAKAAAGKDPKPAGRPKKESTTNTTNGTTTAKKAVGRPKKTAASAKKAAAEPPKPAANISKKRKLTDEPSEESEHEEIARTKRSKTKKDDEEVKKPVKVAKPAAKKPAKASKPKVVINERPTQRLEVFVFGEGSAGELGLGNGKNVVDVKRPRLNPLLASSTVGVVQVAVGGMHCAALTHDGKILTWGVNDQGALGRDTTWEGGLVDIDANGNGSDSDSEASDSGLNPKESTPTAIPADAFPEGTSIVQVAAGDSTTYALTDDGLVYGWGTYRVSLISPFVFLT